MAQHQFASRSWTDTKQSTFLGEIPYTAEYLAITKGKVCKCAESCGCHHDWKTTKSDCNCMNAQSECATNCKSCANLRKQGKPDNTQMQRFGGGMEPTETKRLWTGRMGDSLVIQQDFKAGEALIGYVGNVVRRKQLPQDHHHHVITLDKWAFKLKKDIGEHKKGKTWRDDVWVMDCCGIGNDANYINSTCGNNNATLYVSVVGRLPHPIVYASKDGKSGLNVL